METTGFTDFHLFPLLLLGLILHSLYACCSSQRPSAFQRDSSMLPARVTHTLQSHSFIVITVITKSQANFGISHNFVPSSSAHKLFFSQCEWNTKKKNKNKIDSIHYISVIFSNRESICIIPGLIKDLAPCKYCVCNPHVLPPRRASGVYFCNNWCVLLHRNGGWVSVNIAQVNVHRSSRAPVEISSTRFLQHLLKKLTAKEPCTLHLVPKNGGVWSTSIWPLCWQRSFLIPHCSNCWWGLGTGPGWSRAQNSTTKQVYLNYIKPTSIRRDGKEPRKKQGS